MKSLNETITNVMTGVDPDTVDNEVDELTEASQVQIDNLDKGIAGIIKKLDKVVNGSHTMSKRADIFDGIHGVIVIYQREMAGYRFGKKEINGILNAAGTKFRWMEGGKQSLSIGLKG